MGMILLIVVIVVTVVAIISVCKEKNNKNELVKNIEARGYIINDIIDIPDIEEDTKPFRFMVDKTNKKWFLAKDRDGDAESYDFSDITDFVITYRFKGNSVVKGEKVSNKFSENENNKFLDANKTKKENCEYISFELIYKAETLVKDKCNKFVLFESQEDKFLDARNYDYLASSVCIDNATKFEDILSEIIRTNMGVTESANMTECGEERKNTFTHSNEQEKAESKGEKRTKSKFKKFVKFVEIVGLLIVMGIFMFGEPEVLMMDFISSIDQEDNPYLEMVQNHRPFENGNTYYNAYKNTFDSNQWKYFKAENGLRIVQVTSRYNDIDDVLLTQFVITPAEDGEFYIEPYAMRLSGKNLTKTEINIVLAGVFEGEIANALGELFLYGNLW